MGQNPTFKRGPLTSTRSSWLSDALVEPAKEWVKEIRYDAALACLDFRSHGHPGDQAEMVWYIPQLA